MYSIRKSLFLIILAATLLVDLIISNPQMNIWNIYLSIVWSLGLPIVAIGIYGLLVFKEKINITSLTSTLGMSQLADSKYTYLKINFVITTIGKSYVLKGLTRVINSVFEGIRNTHFPIQYVVDVITEEENDIVPYLKKYYQKQIADGKLRIIIVPKTYSTKNNTKYKARALHYYVRTFLPQHGEITQNNWLFKLDDDTAIHPSSFVYIYEFLKNGPEYLAAQGILAFDQSLDIPLFMKLADSIRTGDDITRFYYASKIKHTPIFGFHGENMLIRADVEHDIGWDFGSVLTEDAIFSYHFAKKYPKKFTFLPTITLGASPTTIKDFITQRARWAAGLLELITKYPGKTSPLFIYSILLWVIGGIFRNIFIITTISILGNLLNNSPIHPIILIPWAIEFAYYSYIYIEGYRFNHFISFKKYPPIYKYIILLALIPIFSTLELIGGIKGLFMFINRYIFKRGHLTFTVISKA